MFSTLRTHHQLHTRLKANVGGSMVCKKKFMLTFLKWFYLIISNLHKHDLIQHSLYTKNMHVDIVVPLPSSISSFFYYNFLILELCLKVYRRILSISSHLINCLKFPLTSRFISSFIKTFEFNFCVSATIYE